MEETPAASKELKINLLFWISLQEGEGILPSGLLCNKLLHSLALLFFFIPDKGHVILFSTKWAFDNNKSVLLAYYDTNYFFRYNYLIKELFGSYHVELPSTSKRIMYMVGCNGITITSDLWVF